MDELRNLPGTKKDMADRKRGAAILARRARKEREQAMKDLGLVKVRGNLGGTYWE
jgi:hypothetical protein